VINAIRKACEMKYVLTSTKDREDRENGEPS
jgi:hypothetical protein